MKQKNLLFVVSALLAWAITSPVAAQNSLDPVEARVLPGWVASDGTRMTAIDMQLAPGWKTYWRAPGDGGIPPTFDWSDSRNMQGVEITWPAPSVFDQNGMRSFGYQDRFILPLNITPSVLGRDVRISVEIDMGVCSDICIPYRLSLTQVLDTTQTRPSPEIAGALAQQPYSSSEAGVTQAICSIRPISDGLQIEASIAMPSAGGQEVMIIEPGLEEVWVSEARTERRGNRLVATSDMIHISGRVFSIDRSEIRITVLGENHAVDIRGCSGS